MSETKIILRHITASDKSELVSLMVRSQEFHSPWIQSPNSGPMFEAYLKRIKRSDHEGFAVCRASDSTLVGVINVNNIVRGSLLTASLGYYVGHSFQGEGYMSAGLKSLVQYAFTTMGYIVWRRIFSPRMSNPLIWLSDAVFHSKASQKNFYLLMGNGETMSAGA